ncbi:hypothetical protein B0A48_00935 [Cryoendolithus antarcticus]|uniref:Uncharacterized protein n=1 Tax=Cryoendolithus antarcticus TaxID=1507870 RepID=A0A1V8TRR0_9PEZI|nr:hypothetical protein B0A48_00935 [Cryoendolithus antarcticus]
MLSMDPPVWVTKQPDPPLTLADMERIRNIGHPVNGHEFRLVPLDPLVVSVEGYRPALVPQIVVWPHGHGIIVRPAPPIPPGNDYAAFLGPVFQDPEKCYGLGMLGGPYKTSVSSHASSESIGGNGEKSETGGGERELAKL